MGEREAERGPADLTAAAFFDVDNTLATAMIDRLMHHGEAIVIHGDSFRLKDRPPE